MGMPHSVRKFSTLLQSYHSCQHGNHCQKYSHTCVRAAFTSHGYYLRAAFIFLIVRLLFEGSIYSKTSLPGSPEKYQEKEEACACGLYDFKPLYQGKRAIALSCEHYTPPLEMVKKERWTEKPRQ